MGVVAREDGNDDGDDDFVVDVRARTARRNSQVVFASAKEIKLCRQ